MGFEIILDNNCYCPRVRCDGCHELIERGAGKVIWEVDDQAQPTGQMMILHKHRCPDGQHRDITAWLWEDLDVHLVWQIQNSGYNLQQARDNARTRPAWRRCWGAKGTAYHPYQAE